MAPVPWESHRFDRFSQRARKVLGLAQEEAQRFNHNYIGTEHLLLGLVREGEGVAAKALTALGVQLEQVRIAVEQIIGRGDRAPVGEIGLTPRARKVIELAGDEARRLGHQYVGTEHLLLGLVREGEGIAAGVLERQGLDLGQIRQQTILVLSQAGAVTPRHLVEALPVRGTVVSCRYDDQDLAAIDTLVEAGIRASRSEAAAWLVHAGIQAQRDLFDRVERTVGEIRRLRQEAQSMAQEHATSAVAPPPVASDETNPVSDVEDTEPSP